MKKKALVLAICMAVSVPAVSAAQAFPQNIAGLNLGDIQSSTTLGQPFRGEIPILLSRLEDARALRVRLASASVFQKAGVDYQPFLQNLTFNITARGNKPVVAVRSSQPVELPFLNFVLEVTSPQGVVYQDYTILIDPPGYQGEQAEAFSDNLENSFKNVAPQVQARKQNKPALDLAALQVDGLKIIKGKAIKYEVLQGDKLADIAAALKTSQVSLKRMIEVIHRANPNAFVNNDIHKLKQGVYLKIPGANELKNFSYETVSKTLNSTSNKKAHKTSDNTKSSAKKVVTSKVDATGNAVTYKVKKGDTLSGITQKFASNDLSFTKRMFAIFKANPEAFSKNKMNLLKAGKVLTIPYLATTSDESEKEFKLSNNTQTANDKIISESQGSRNTHDASGEAEFTQQLETGVPVADSSLSKASGAQTTNTQNSALVINKLEKRVRELRKSLRESRNKLSELEQVLNSKNEIISSLKQGIQTNQESRIDKKQVTIPPVENATKNTTKKAAKTVIKDAAQNKVEEKMEVNKPAHDSINIKENSNTPEQLNLKQPENPESQTEIGISPKAGTIASSTLNKLPVNDELFSNLANLDTIKSLLKNPSINDYSLGFLALLLGLGLITYRKELYSYVAISEKKYPKFYPAEQEQVHIRTSPEEPIVDLEPDVEITTRESDEDVDQSILEECDKLIDELSDELNDQKKTHDLDSSAWDDLEKICNNYISKYKTPEAELEAKKTVEDGVASAINDTGSQAATGAMSFEAMVTDLVESLDEKAKFSEGDLTAESVLAGEKFETATDSQINNPVNESPYMQDPELLHDFGILVDRNKKAAKSNIPKIKMDI